jgi:hypothetical protein
MPLIYQPAAATTSAQPWYSAATPVVYMPLNWIASYDTNATVSGSHSFASVGWTIYLIPFEVRRTITIDSLDVVVSTGFTAGNSSFGRIGIYRSHTSGEPTPSTLAVESGAMNWATTGSKTATVNTQLTPALYYFAVQADSPAQGALRAAITASQSRANFGWAAAGSSPSAMVSYGTGSAGFPSIPAAATLTSTGGSPIGVWSRITSVP